MAGHGPRRRRGRATAAPFDNRGPPRVHADSAARAHPAAQGARAEVSTDLRVPRRNNASPCSRRFNICEWAGGPNGTRAKLQNPSEPPRLLRRLQSLRGWGYDTSEPVLPGGARARSADGPGARGQARVAVGSDQLDCREDRLYRGDAPEVGAPGRA